MPSPYPVVETRIPPPPPPPPGPISMGAQPAMPAGRQFELAGGTPSSAALASQAYPMPSGQPGPIAAPAGPVSSLAAPPAVQPMGTDPMGSSTMTGMPGGPITAAANAGSPARTSAKADVARGMLEDAFADVKAGRYASAAGQVVRGAAALPVAAAADMIRPLAPIASSVVSGVGDFAASALGMNSGGAGPISTATAAPVARPAAAAAAAAVGGPTTDVRLGVYNPPAGAAPAAAAPAAPGEAIPGLDPSIRKIVAPDGSVTYTNAGSGAQIVPMAGGQPAAAPTVAPTGPVAGPVTSLYTDQALQAARAAALARGDVAAVQASYAPAGAAQPQTTPTIIGGDPRESAWNKSFDGAVLANRVDSAVRLNPGRKGQAMAAGLTAAYDAQTKGPIAQELENTRQAGETSRTGTREAAATGRTAMQESGQDRRTATTTGAQERIARERTAAEAPLRTAQAAEAGAKAGSLQETLEAQREHKAAVASGDQARIAKAEERLRGALGKFESPQSDLYSSVQVGGGVDDRGMARGQGAVIYDRRTGETKAQYDSSGKKAATAGIQADQRALAIKNDPKLTYEQKRTQLQALGYK
jgi:hypothetical protein